jgi:hypothetical protein
VDFIEPEESSGSPWTFQSEQDLQNFPEELAATDEEMDLVSNKETVFQEEEIDEPEIPHKDKIHVCTPESPATVDFAWKETAQAYPSYMGEPCKTQAESSFCTANPAKTAEAAFLNEPVQEPAELPVNGSSEPTDIDGLFNSAGQITPFARQNKPVDWVRLGENDTTALNASFGKVMNNTFILACMKRYDHLILGKSTSDGREKYYLGVPDIYSHEYRTSAYRLGFNQFKTASDVTLKNGEYGYWIRQL